MDITIRAERTSDYSDIADLTYSAFVAWQPADYLAEPLLVDVLRHNAMFDPELSLVAEHAGRIVGHVLFSPFAFVVLGTRHMGTVLAPIGVDPAYQRMGIGAMLIARGHEIAREKGYALSILCGHPEYYPRFGYERRMFALSGATIAVGGWARRPVAFDERPVLASDLAWIVPLWEHMHGGDDLALFPGNTVAQWFSHVRGLPSSVITRDGQAVGYIRYKASRPIAIRELLVREGGALDILAFVMERRQGTSAGECASSLSAGALEALFDSADAVEVRANRGTSDAFMLKVLREDNAVVRRYAAEVAAGSREPAIIAFPPVMDIDA